MVHEHVSYFAAHMAELKVCSHELDSLGGEAYEKTREIRREYYALTRADHRGSRAASPAAWPVNLHVATMALFGTLNWLYRWYSPDPGDGSSRTVATQITNQFLSGLCPALATDAVAPLPSPKGLSRPEGIAAVYLPDLELHQPETLEEAARLMQRYTPAARFLAGGTDLLVDLKVARVAARSSHLDQPHRRNAIDRGDQRRPRESVALATLTELNDAPLPGAFCRDQGCDEYDGRPAHPQRRHRRRQHRQRRAVRGSAPHPDRAMHASGGSLLDRCGIRDVPL